MKSVIEHNEIGIFTPIDQMERQFKYKSAAHVSQLKEDITSDGAGEPVESVIHHVNNRSSFNL